MDLQEIVPSDEKLRNTWHQNDCAPLNYRFIQEWKQQTWTWPPEVKYRPGTSYEIQIGLNWIWIVRPTPTLLSPPPDTLNHPHCYIKQNLWLFLFLVQSSTGTVSNTTEERFYTAVLHKEYLLTILLIFIVMRCFQSSPLTLFFRLTLKTKKSRFHWPRDWEVGFTAQNGDNAMLTIRITKTK